jgi:hypothetical protein
LPKHLPTVGGKQLSRTTIYRWKKNYSLETEYIGGRLFTSLEAVERMNNRRNGAADFYHKKLKSNSAVIKKNASSAYLEKQANEAYKLMDDIRAKIKKPR